MAKRRPPQVHGLVLIDKMKKEMLEAATELDFEKAATIRDQIKSYEKIMLL
jgi:excinuclease UvrABC nuclease subunit